MKYSPANLPDNIRKCLPQSEKQKLGKAGLTMAEITAKSEVVAEREMHKQFSNWLNLHRIFFIHSRMDRPSSQNLGVPDFVFSVLRKSTAIPAAVEFKTPSGVLSDDQLTCIARMQDNGWMVRVAKSVDGAIRFVTELMR